MQPCEQMHDYMFIIYGSNVSVLYFVKVYTFLILKVLLQLFCFLLINVSTQEKKKKVRREWKSHQDIDHDA